MATLPTYILITPARNEAQFIELTLQSMVAQTYRPLKWIIVSDGSTDGTDDIVRKYAADNPWIELLRMPERAERHFAGKVHAFNAGYAKAKELNPDV
jgi:biofilm PGA synthesis N-glycosyltransferase PgaC